MSFGIGPPKIRQLRETRRALTLGLVLRLRISKPTYSLKGGCVENNRYSEGLGLGGGDDQR